MLVVEDSLTVRRYLVEVLSADPDIEVVGECGDGRAGVEMCARLRPNVVTLDMMMPVMTGLEATERIMAFTPTPILIVSASTNRGELFKSFDALAAGAVDVLDKPGGDLEVGEGWDQRLVARVKLVARIAVITHPRARLPDYGRTLPAGRSERHMPGSAKVVAIGASTGGPSAVLTILSSLPADFPLPILLVVHMGKPFGVALAEWLDQQCKLEVAVARDGETLPGRGHGRVIVAHADRHLVLANGRIALSDGPERHFCRPSVDTLFESIAADCGRDAIAVLLTGMGRDGAEGMLALKKAGGSTIAQDEATSVVFGMPREAIRLGAAQRILPIDEIALEIQELAGARSGGTS